MYKRMHARRIYVCLWLCCVCMCVSARMSRTREIQIQSENEQFAKIVQSEWCGCVAAFVAYVTTDILYYYMCDVLCVVCVDFCTKIIVLWFNLMFARNNENEENRRNRTRETFATERLRNRHNECCCCIHTQHTRIRTPYTPCTSVCLCDVFDIDHGRCEDDGINYYADLLPVDLLSFTLRFIYHFVSTQFWA